MKSLYDELTANAKPSTEPHPLEYAVLKVFEEFAEHGVTSLCLTQIAVGLAGASISPGRGHKAYMTVAEDVLGYMTSYGKSCAWASNAHNCLPRRQRCCRS